VRTQGYRTRLTLTLPGGALTGRLGVLDQFLFVVEEQAWGGQQFLRVVEQRDFQLGTSGPVFRTDVADIWTPGRELARQMLDHILADLTYLLNTHLGVNTAFTTTEQP
jgi:hypothetical protein